MNVLYFKHSSIDEYISSFLQIKATLYLYIMLKLRMQKITAIGIMCGLFLHMCADFLILKGCIH